MTSKEQRWPVILISSVAALGGLLFGFDTAIISGAIPYINVYFKLDVYSLGWAVSAILIGCAVGALLGGQMADRLGRRYVLKICALFFAVSGIGAACSTSLGLFIAFRLIGGLGVGAAAMVSPMYIAETVPASRRGAMVSLYQLAIVSGILLAYFSNYIFKDAGSNNWRWMFLSQALPALLFWLLLFMVPETPRWLARNRQSAAALTVLEKLNGPTAAEKLLLEINASFRSEKSPDLKELFSKAYRSIMVTGIMLAIFQQITGINAVLYYAPVIFSKTGLDTASALLQTIGIGVVNVISTMGAIWLVDRVGRKIFLLTGSLLMGVSLVSLALCFHFNYFGNYVVLLSILIYVAAFGCTLGAVTWVFLSEIFPNRIRSAALSLATLALWLADFVVTYSFPVMTDAFGTALTLSCYATFCFIAFIYILRKVPETKGRSLEEIESLFIQ
jgi:sugar porter (SP) family MFS transporter